MDGINGITAGYALAVLGHVGIGKYEWRFC